MSMPYQNVNYTLLNSDLQQNLDTEIMSQEKEVMSCVFTKQNPEDYVSIEAEMKPKSEVKQSFFENITTIVHILIVQFVIFILYLSFSYEVELFTWHPILLSIGWSLFMTEAILAISGENWLTKFISTKNKVLVHWVLQICASACILSGFIIVVVNKSLKNKQHFKTWHGTIGLVSFIFLIPTCLLGVLSLYKVNLRIYINPKLNKGLHIFLGVSTFILGAITIILSLYSNWFVKKTNYTAQVICFIAVLITSLWVLIKPVKFLLKNIL